MSSIPTSAMTLEVRQLMSGTNAFLDVDHLEDKQETENQWQGIGEAGSVTVQQSNASEWHTIQTNHSFENPVVVMGPLSFNNSAPATVRVRNTTSNSFEFQIDEWNYQDGSHGLERLSWVVIEAGEHVLKDGSRVIAGKNRIDHNWKQIEFGFSFLGQPVVFTQAASRNGSDAVTTRVTSVDNEGFRVRLQEEERNGSHGTEFIDWIAIDYSTADGSPGMDIGRTGNLVDHQWRTIALNATEFPRLLAQDQSTNGSDPGTLRYRNLTATTVDLMFQEETSHDSEVAHGDEAVGYWTLSDGEIQGQVFHAELVNLGRTQSLHLFESGQDTPISDLEIRQQLTEADGTIWVLTEDNRLHRISPDGIWSRIATEVQKFGIRNDGKLHLLKTNGDLNRGVDHTSWTNVADFLLNRDGTLYYLSQGGWFSHLTDDGWQQLFNNGQVIRDFAVAANDSVFTLDSNGNVHAHSRKSDGHYAVRSSASWGNKADLWFDSQDRLILIEKGQTHISRSIGPRGNNGWDNLGRNFISYEVTQDDKFWVLESDGELRFEGQVKATDVARFELTENGDIVAFDNNERRVEVDGISEARLSESKGQLVLELYDGETLIESTSIRQTGTTTSGVTFVLTRDGRLGSIGMWLPVATDVLRFEVSNDDLFYLTETDDLFWLNGTSHVRHARNTSDFQLNERNLYRLQSDGILDITRLDGSYSYRLRGTSDEPLMSFDLDDDGNLYTLDVQGKLVRIHSDRTEQWIDGDVTQFEIAPNGDVYSIDVEGVLRVNGEGGWSNTSEFWFGEDDLLYWIGTSGIFERKAVDEIAWERLDNDLEKFEVAANGDIYSLGRDGWLNVNGVAAWNNTEDFWFGNDGLLYWISRGNTKIFERKGLDDIQWKRLDSDMIKYEIAPNGDVYTLGLDRWLNVNGQAVWANTRDFWIDATDEMLYWKGTTGIFERKPLSGSQWERLDNDVYKHVVRSDGAIFSLGYDKWLNIDGRAVWNNTADFWFDSNGYLFWESTGGLLEWRDANGAWHTLGTHVTSHFKDVTGAWWALQENGLVKRNGQHVWSNVSDLKQRDDGQIYMLQTNKVLYEIVTEQTMYYARKIATRVIGYYPNHSADGLHIVYESQLPTDENLRAFTQAQIPKQYVNQKYYTQDLNSPLPWAFVVIDGQGDKRTIASWSSEDEVIKLINGLYATDTVVEIVNLHTGEVKQWGQANMPQSPSWNPLHSLKDLYRKLGNNRQWVLENQSQVTETRLYNLNREIYAFNVAVAQAKRDRPGVSEFQNLQYLNMVSIHLEVWNEFTGEWISLVVQSHEKRYQRPIAYMQSVLDSFQKALSSHVFRLRLEASGIYNLRY